MALSICASAYATDNTNAAKANATDTQQTIETIVVDEKTETDFNIDFPFKKARNKKKKSSSVSLGMDMDFIVMFGFVGIVGGDNDAAFQMGRSVEFYMPSIVQYKLSTGRSTPSVSLGVGFGLQHFFGKSRVLFVQEEATDDYPLLCGRVPEGSYRSSSKINKFAITMPLLIEQEVGWGGKVALGAMLDFNTHLGATSKYRIGDSRYEDYFGHLAMRTISYEIMAAVSSSSMGIYVKYVPVNVFKKGFGPNTKNLSVGVIIGL